MSRQLGIPEKAAVVAGVLAPPTVAKAREMNQATPGVEIPDTVIDRLAAAGGEDEKSEAIAIAVEIIERLKSMDLVGGFCLMTEGDYETAVEVIKQAGLMKE